MRPRARSQRSRPPQPSTAERAAGFERLAEVPRELASTVDGAPFILTMFQPEPSTRRLFQAALSFQRFGPLRGALATVRAFWRFPLVALGLVVVAIALAALEVVPWWLAVVLIALAPWILVIGVLRDVLEAFADVARNDFGLCRLGPGSGRGHGAHGVAAPTDPASLGSCVDA